DVALEDEEVSFGIGVEAHGRSEGRALATIDADLWDAAAMDAGVVVHLEGIDEVVGDDLPHQPDTRQPLDERRVVEVDIVRRDVDMCHAGIFVTGNLKAPPTPKSTSDH